MFLSLIALFYVLIEQGKSSWPCGAMQSEREASYTSRVSFAGLADARKLLPSLQEKAGLLRFARNDDAGTDTR
jgi:hypothetical protein